LLFFLRNSTREKLKHVKLSTNNLNKVEVPVFTQNCTFKKYRKT